MEIEGLVDGLRIIKDPRRKYGNIRHKLVDILVIGLCTVLSGGEDFVDMEEVGRERIEWFKTFIELPNGIPDSDTFRRVFEKLNPTGLSESIHEWLKANKGGKLINIDGKTIRGSGNSTHNAYHVVSAWVGEDNITLGELAVPSKTNEIPAVRELLGIIDIDNSVVTADAMHCQSETVKRIIKESGGSADYALAVKENQEELHDNIKLYFNKEESEYISSTLEKGHGRIEKRTFKLETRITWLSDKSKWEKLNAIGCIESEIEEKGTLRSEKRYFITSLTDINTFSEAVRGHWSIENNLHWMLDVMFKEDKARARKDNSPLNMNILRKTALKLLSDYNPQQKRLSLRKKMLIAAMNPDKLDAILFQSSKQ
jgi:predicted transposase YbfD/YdcC